MIRCLIPVLLLVLTACQISPESGKPPDSGLEGFDPDGVENERAACEKRGGTFSRAGKSGGMICVETTRDAGKSCTAGSQCEGLCLSRSQSCAPVKPLFGCNDILTESGSTATICID